VCLHLPQTIVHRLPPPHQFQFLRNNPDLLSHLQYLVRKNISEGGHNIVCNKLNYNHRQEDTHYSRTEFKEIQTIPYLLFKYLL